jgi:6-phospho-3-hexuloisomerase
MTRPTLRTSAQPVLDEIGDVFARMDGAWTSDLAGEILGARRILCHSAGRTGLMLRAFVMRLVHLGCDAHMVGDVTAPPIGAGDLLLVNAATGDLPSAIAHLASASRAGARRVVLTAATTGAAREAADRVFVLPAQTMLDDTGAARRSALPMGSQYELALLVATELVVLDIMRMTRTDFAAMRRRHANIQ